MNGVRFLLDTNYLLGLLKGQAEVVASIQGRGADWRWYGFSSITRMESLGFPAITSTEEEGITELLARLHYFPITPEVETAAIILRRRHKLKLPDAIILATAQVHSL